MTSCTDLEAVDLAISVRRQREQLELEALLLRVGREFRQLRFAGQGQSSAQLKRRRRLVARCFRNSKKPVLRINISHNATMYFPPSYEKSHDEDFLAFSTNPAEFISATKIFIGIVRVHLRKTVAYEHMNPYLRVRVRSTAAELVHSR